MAGALSVEEDGSYQKYQCSNRRKAVSDFLAFLEQDWPFCIANGIGTFDQNGKTRRKSDFHMSVIQNIPHPLSYTTHNKPEDIIRNHE